MDSYGEAKQGMALSSEYKRLTYESFITNFIGTAHFQHVFLTLSRTSAALYDSL